MLQPEIIINLNNLRSNYHYIQSIVNDSKVMAVVKGNAYGHGINEIAKLASEYGIKHAVVNNLSEANIISDLSNTFSRPE